MNHTYFIGIDVAKAKFDVAWLRDHETLKFLNKVFKNHRSNFSELTDWLRKNVTDDFTQIHVTLEPTGVYHLALAHFLHDLGCWVQLINPARLPAFAASKANVHKTDKKDSCLLARFGRENPSERWIPEPALIRELKSKATRMEALKQDILRETNRLEKAEFAESPQEVIDSIKKVIAVLRDEIIALKNDIDQRIDDDPTLKNDRELLQSIPSVAEVCSLHMLLLYHSRPFERAAQMAAFVGLIPRVRESGVLRGRTVLSKKGSPSLRKLLYMPAVCATIRNPDIKAQYERLIANGKNKKLAIGAAMRRLVHICFGVLKHQKPYQAKCA